MLDLKRRTIAVGVPWENPVPIGCSTYRTLERLVQLHSFWVGKAWPFLQVKGYAVSDIVLGIICRKLTPFSWKKPSNDEQPGPPFVLKSTQLSHKPSQAWIMVNHIPEDEIIKTSFGTGRKKPEEQLRNQ